MVCGKLRVVLSSTIILEEFQESPELKLKTFNIFNIYGLKSWCLWSALRAAEHVLQFLSFGKEQNQLENKLAEAESKCIHGYDSKDKTLFKTDIRKEGLMCWSFTQSDL